MDVPKIQRGRHESVMVSRFNAPGGPETMGDSNGGAGLDRFSAEFSFNNDLNSRNWNARSAYYPFLTSHVNQSGYFSNYGDLINAGSSSVNPTNYAGTGSIYQVNRNTLRHLEISGTTIITGSQRDNFWVQHSIPRSDLQYAWINASYESVDPSGLGHWYESLFEYTARESTVFADSFSSTLDPSKWTQYGVSMKSSSAGDNQVARFGNWATSESNASPRHLTSVDSFELPFRVEYDYAQGQYENRDSKVYLEFDGNSVMSGSAQTAFSSSTGKYTLSFWYKAGEIPASTKYLFTWNLGSPHDSVQYLYVLDDRIGRVRSTTGLNANHYATRPFAIGEWVHVAMSIDDADPAAEPKFYFNGNYEPNSSITPGSGIPRVATSFCIGGRDPNYATFPAQGLTGSLDSILDQ